MGVCWTFGLWRKGLEQSTLCGHWCSFSGPWCGSKEAFPNGSPTSMSLKKDGNALGKMGTTGNMERSRTTKSVKPMKHRGPKEKETLEEITRHLLSLSFFKDHFLCGSLLKHLMNLLQYCFCFTFCFFFLAVRHMGSSLPHQGSNPHPWSWNVKS